MNKYILAVVILCNFVSACKSNDFEDEAERSILNRIHPKQFVNKSASTKECRPKQDVGRIHFDCQISDENYETLRKDFEYLQKMEFRGTAAKQLQQVLEINSLTGDSVFRWLEENIQFLLDESFEVNSKHFFASNKSSSLLIKYQRPFALVEVPGFGQVEVNSQRVGIVVFGKDFFKQNSDEKFNLENFDTIHRLASLFHEARHNHGRGPSFGFPHVRCPLEDAYAGKSDCDVCNNGAYALEILFMQSAKDGCDQCNSDEKIFLSLIYKDLQKRILPGVSECDATLAFPEGGK